MNIKSQKSGAFLWKIKKIVKKGDYLYAVVPDHPNATKYGYVLEHRIVMENHLGRLLYPNEIVHHANGNKHDNHIRNLELQTRSEHSRKHTLLRGYKMVCLKCPCCKKIFHKRLNETHIQKGGKFDCCSQSCGSKFAWKIRKFGKTKEVQMAISENIVFEYHSNDNSEQTDRQRDA